MAETGHKEPRWSDLRLSERIAWSMQEKKLFYTWFNLMCYCLMTSYLLIIMILILWKQGNKYWYSVALSTISLKWWRYWRRLTSCCIPPAVSVQTGKTCHGTRRDTQRASHRLCPHRSGLRETAAETDRQKKWICESNPVGLVWRENSYRQNWTSIFVRKAWVNKNRMIFYSAETMDVLFLGA